MIIEDELFVAAELEDILSSLGHRVIGIERTAAAAIASINTKRPDLILADVQLADGSSGIDAVNHCLKSISVPVIFVTAYPERLLTGALPEPEFVLAKPFRSEAVRALVNQCLFFNKNVNSGREAI
jgi:CheY-like chemotaxis protein